MKQTDLRIGNYVDFECANTKEAFHVSEGKITAIHADHVYINTIKVPRLDMLRPIPLNEEWLLKFRFKEDVIGVFAKGVLDLERLLLDSPEWEICFNEDQTGHTLKYVHQIQNLYFDLTGKELELISCN